MSLAPRPIAPRPTRRRQRARTRPPWPAPAPARMVGLAAVLVLAGCGGGNGNGSSVAPPPAFAPPPASLAQASAATPFGSSCNGAPQTGTLYHNAAVEPYVAVNPTNALNVIGVWQQDRWSNGGAQGVIASASFDGAHSWSRHPLPTARCAGGTAANGGDYERASDPWVSFSPNGIAYAITLAFDDSSNMSAVLVTRSSDGGQTWSAPVTLIRDDIGPFDDKESITADPTDSAYVYAVWDRLMIYADGPAWFARTTDGGQTWDAAQKIYDPGTNRQTLGNQIVVLSDGTLLDVFTLIDYASGGSAEFEAIRSTDHGASWSAPFKIANDLAIGTSDPQTGQPIRDGAGMADVATGPGSEVAVAWQDARFSGGRRDGIALSLSFDGGATWSTPVEVNGDPAAQAFTPSVRILNDGTVVVTYFDLRDDTADPSTLAADYWLTASQNGTVWHEICISGPFNLDLAPNANGLFLGDYQGLGTTGTEPLPFFAQTVTGATGPTDIFALPPPVPVPLLTVMAQGYRAPAAATPRLTPRYRGRISANLRRLLKRRERPPPR